MKTNLEGLIFEDGGLTLNLEADATNTTILEHCLIGRVLTDKEFNVYENQISLIFKNITHIP